MGQLVVQEFVTADGFAANTNNEFTAYEMLEGGTAEFDRSQLAWLETVTPWCSGQPPTACSRSSGLPRPPPGRSSPRR